MRLPRRITSGIALAATAAMSACTAAPAGATPSGPWDCDGPKAGFRGPVTEAEINLCAREKATTPTTPTTTPNGGHGTDPGLHLPDLSFPLFAGAVLVVGGLIGVFAHGDGDVNHPEGSLARGIAEAENAASRATAWGAVGIGAPFLAFALAGPRGAVLAGFVGLLVIVGAIAGVSSAQQRKRGYEVTRDAWLEGERKRAAAAAAAPGEFDDLGLNIRSEHTGPFMPEPQLSPEDAEKIGAWHAQTGGFIAPEGSAEAVLLDERGNVGPAAAGLAQVAEQLRWGTWTGQGDERAWTPYVTLDSIQYDEAGDCDVYLNISHASIDEGTISKALPALLRVWKCKDGNVSREVDGRIKLEVTNRTLKQRLREEQAASGADEVWDF